MKKQLVKIFAILCGVLMFAGVGEGASPKRSGFEIPFDFIVGKEVFPAGKYKFERLNPINPDLLVLKSSDGKKKIVFQTQRVRVEKTSQPSRLTFRRGDAGYFLSDIWQAGEKYGHHIFQSARRLADGEKPLVVYPSGN